MPIARDFLYEPSQPSASSGRASMGNKSLLQESDELSPSEVRDSRSLEGEDELHSCRYNGRLSPHETRQELIERIKREQKNSRLRDTPPSIYAAQESERSSSTASPKPAETPATSLQEPPQRRSEDGETQLAHASSIERPRSALHAGDFREQSTPARSTSIRPTNPSLEQSWLSTSPTSPWYTATIPHKHYFQTGHQPYAGSGSLQKQSRTRAASYTAILTSFAFLPPTSGLANESLREDYSGPTTYERPRSPDKTRRHTFSPHSLQTYRGAPRHSESHYTASSPRFDSTSRRDGRSPYQAHQPRRSTSSFCAGFGATTPPIPSAHNRLVGAQASSPLQRLPMVGRYEESILRGRMSSLPSRPLDFVAQIGVLGKGKCKSSLRCPPHVAVPFPAVFYNYGGRPSSPTSSEGPSPYVGMIDLEENLRESAWQDMNTKHRSDDPRMAHRDTRANSNSDERPSKYPTHSPQGIPSGGYRMPQQGQIQMIIKNPNKTAVKLFLVPYDLHGMEPGQKTFIRQRSYSAGPILDMPLDTRRNLGTDRPEAAITNSDDPKDRPTLRYLIHLNICCPVRGRFYLYKSIRVVFANRVPDGKEKLRQEIQLPDPRYSLYRPGRDALSGTANRRGVSQDSDPSEGLPLSKAAVSHDYQGLQHLRCHTTVQNSVQHAPKGTNTYVLPFYPTSPSDEPTEIPSPDSDIFLETSGKRSTSQSPNQVLGNMSPAGTNLGSHESIRPRSRNAFQRLTREEYSNDSLRDRTRSPQAREGLLALQLKDSGGQSFR
ncbi:MAG: hypothetical protein M1828_001183 [Chrysothrix sp. TS-e1954]|nr:MAG: hypothetical protein M1828_001183 [Chrysothrix sp. TS-e1954]